ncbi:30S ribosomal protein S8e [Candidatus Woesearchaeota archaeon]|nr:30S ribosomal protein S8e [Candidatus Woesearchaeota archaeon]
MAISQVRPRRKVTGSRYKDLRKKKQFELGRDPTLTKIGEKNKKLIRIMSGKYKEITLVADTINVIDSKSKKSMQAKIKTVVENPANRHFVRRNILTKGTIVETDKGKVKITSRPGQEGNLNGILVSQ